MGSPPDDKTLLQLLAGAVACFAVSIGGLLVAVVCGSIALLALAVLSCV